MPEIAIFVSEKSLADKPECQALDRSPMRDLTPDTIRPPFARYAHGVEIPPGWRTVRTSGQLGVSIDDTVPEDAYSQAVICFQNITEILALAGMSPNDVAHVTAYVTDRTHMAGYMKARDEFMAGAPRPAASTLLIVSGFTRPEFKVEVEVVAAAAPPGGEGS